MGWWIALGVVIALGALPLGISARYSAGGPLVRAILGPIRLTLFPRAKKEEKEKKPEQKKPEPEKPEPKAGEPTLPQPPQPPKPEEKKEKGGPITDFLPLVKTGLDFLGDFRRKLRLNNLELKITMAGGDPCDLAVNYGRAWAAVGGLLPQLERLFVIKKRNIEVACDFTAAETSVLARVDMTITLGRLLGLALRYGLRALKEFLTIRKKRKGGAVI